MKTLLKDTIILYRGENAWIMDDPDPQVKELFGASCIPTAFTNEAEAGYVLSRIRELNPGREVIVKQDGR